MMHATPPRAHHPNQPADPEADRMPDDGPMARAIPRSEADRTGQIEPGAQAWSPAVLLRAIAACLLLQAAILGGGWWLADGVQPPPPSSQAPQWL